MPGTSSTLPNERASAPGNNNVPLLLMFAEARLLTDADRRWLTAPLAELYQFDRPYPAERMTVEATDSPWYKAKG